MLEGIVQAAHNILVNNSAIISGIIKAHPKILLSWVIVPADGEMLEIMVKIHIGHFLTLFNRSTHLIGSSMMKKTRNITSIIYFLVMLEVKSIM